MKSFILVPLYLLLSSPLAPTHDELQDRYHQFLIRFPHVFAPLQMTTYKEQQSCSKVGVSVHKMKSFLTVVRLTDN